MTDTYDPATVRQRLDTLERPRAAAFAAMCAELLAPVWPRYCALTRLSDPALLEQSLDELWAALEGTAGTARTAGTDGSDAGLRARLAALEDAAPDEDDDPWVFETGYAMNACSSTLYAVQVLLDGDPGRAEWAARQVWEAADLTAEDEEGLATFGPPDEESDVAAAASAFVDESLVSAADPGVEPADLRARARAAAALWWRPAS